MEADYLGHEDARAHPAHEPRSLGRFLVTFGLVLVAAEGLLRLIGLLQVEIGWAAFDYGLSYEWSGFISAVINGLLSLLTLVALFGFFEWHQAGFKNFKERYSEGLVYGSTAIVIATILQTLAFSLLSGIDIDPFLQADDLGPLLIAFPIVYMIVIGFFEYWLHRALHDIPVLWRLHAIHHQIEEMNAARSYSHWAQDTLYLGVITIPLVFIIENPQEHVALLTTFYLVSNYYMHTDNPAMSFPPLLRHVLADNIYHHYHHSRAIEHWGRNYCSFFSFYDRIFGTQYMPEDETFHPTGIDGYRPLSGWTDYLTRPFTRSG
ncbi:MAG: sterol desaturase family protein [Pseudomonadota bacterium]